MTIQSSDSHHRFFALDALRGVAALGVVVWHYRHFAEAGKPFVNFLLLFQVFGFLMVDLFFCLSGFIFFWKYSELIIEKSISFKRFIWLRLTRLYPLHFVTLILVGVGQLFLGLFHNEFFVSQDNDLKHLFLNILFISNWGLQDDHSFNTPIWSVSTEVLLYFIFYLYLSQLRPRKLLWSVAMIILGWQLWSRDLDLIIFNSELGRGLTSFFAGGLAFQIFRIATSSNRKIYIGSMGLIGFVSVFFWISLFWFAYEYHDLAPFVIDWWFITFLIGSPFTVLFLALLDAEKVLAIVFKKLAFLGDISYSVYLLHFPLQVFMFCASKYYSINFSNEWVFLIYFSATIILAVASHRWLEIPCQRYLRSKFSFK